MNSGRIAIGFVIILTLAVMMLAETAMMPTGYAATNENETTTAAVTVNGFVSITLFKAPISFPSVDPNTANTPASNNNFTIQIDETTNAPTMVFLNGSQFVYTSYNFNVANMSLNVTGSGTATANSSCSGTLRCRYSIVPFWLLNDTAASLPKNNTVGHYIDIPTSQTPGAYQANVRVCAQQQAATNECV